MDTKKKVTVSWSGGKDVMLALSKIFQSEEYEVVHLHCILTKETRRVGMHGTPEELIEKQSAALGFPLVKAYLEASESNEIYESLIIGLYKSFHADGITHIMFGDIFLEDLKAYRQALLSRCGLKGIFPLWKISSVSIVKDLIASGFKTVICACDSLCYEHGLLGRTIDEDFVTVLPEKIDPAGENGEFHTFVFDGPLFKKPVPFSVGPEVSRTYSFKFEDKDGNAQTNEMPFYFQELLPLTKDR